MRAALTAKVADASGHPLTGGTLQVRNSSGSVVATLTPSGGAGYYVGSAPLVRTRTAFRIVFLGDAGHAPSSAAVIVLPKVSLSTPAAPTSAVHGRTFSVSVTLAPKHSAGSNAVQFRFYRRERSGSTWVWRLRKTVTSKAYDYYSASRCRASLSLPYAGTWRILAYHAEDSLNASTSSGYRGIVVR